MAEAFYIDQEPYAGFFRYGPGNYHSDLTHLFVGSILADLETKEFSGTAAQLIKHVAHLIRSQYIACISDWEIVSFHEIRNAGRPAFQAEYLQ
jgi:hypothetical protein